MNSKNFPNLKTPRHLAIVGLFALLVLLTVPIQVGAQGQIFEEPDPTNTGGGNGGSQDPPSGSSGSGSPMVCRNFSGVLLPKKIVNLWSGKCLNVLNWGLHNGANVVQATNCGINTSKWWISDGAPTWPVPYVNIASVHSQKYLNVLNLSQSNGANVVQADRCDLESSDWRITQIGTSSNGLPVYTIRARHSDQCLNVLNWGRNNGANVVQAQNCSIPSSFWYILPTSL